MTMGEEDKDDDQGGKRDAVYTLDAIPVPVRAERPAPLNAPHRTRKKTPSLAGRRFSVW